MEVRVGVGDIRMRVEFAQPSESIKNMTSAMCTKFDPGAMINCRASCVSLVNCSTHVFTRESQEVRAGLKTWKEELLPSLSIISPACMPHSGQLNITTSTLLGPTKSGISAIIYATSNDDALLVRIKVSSWVAHMSPSRPVSVGMIPSKRTLEVGSVQSPTSMASEHCPASDDPLTDTAGE